MLSEAPVLGLLGWSEHFRTEFEPYAPPGLRARAASRCSTAASTSSRPTDGEVEARITGRLRHDGEFPAVGDWVAPPPDGRDPGRPAAAHGASSAAPPATRRSSRSLAANVDTVVPRHGASTATSTRAGSSATSCSRGRAAPTRSIVLTKLDLGRRRRRGDRRDRVGRDRRARRTPSARVTGEGLEELEPYLGPGRTVVLLGSSGRRQVDARERAARRGAAGDQGDPRLRRARPAHDDARAS